MSAAHDERMWFLKRGWGGGGWCSHPWRGIKKWDAHVAKLVRDGALEQDPRGYQVWRITDAGAAMLAARKGGAA